MKRLLRKLLSPFFWRIDRLIQQQDEIATRLSKIEDRLETKLTEMHDQQGTVLAELHGHAASLGKSIEFHTERTSTNLLMKLQSELAALKLLMAKRPWLAGSERQAHAPNTETVELELRGLIGAVSEVYQDVEVKGQLIAPGVRECRSRLEALMPEIGSRDVILEAGSNFGYFARNIAARQPDSLVVSVENDHASVLLQQRLLQAEDPSNVILVEGTVDHHWLSDADQSCTIFDTILLLSVLHHYAPHRFDQVVDSYDRLAKKLIVELPHPEEVYAYGQDIIARFNEFDRDLRPLLAPETRRDLLGSSPSHLDRSLHRDIYSYTNRTFTKTSTRSYIGDPNRKTVGENPAFEFTRDDGEWTFSKFSRNSSFVPGVLLWDIRELGRIAWPTPDSLVRQFDEITREPGHADRRDVRPWNLLYTAQGMHLIDSHDETVPKFAGESEATRSWLASLDI